MATERKDIENNGTYYRKQAQEALKAAKMLEAQRKAQGAVWVKGENRSHILCTPPPGKVKDNELKRGR